MHYPYQAQANALPGAVVGSEFADQGYDPSMWPYQAQANAQINNVVESYDIQQNRNPVQPMMRRWGWQAAQHSDIAARSSTLNVAGLGVAMPRSGSAVRSVQLTPGVRLINGLGDVFDTAKSVAVTKENCLTDREKFEAGLAYGITLLKSYETFDDEAQIRELTNNIGNVFGETTAICLIRLAGQNLNSISAGDPQRTQQMMEAVQALGLKGFYPNVFATLNFFALDASAEDVKRVAAAGQRMQEKGWWTKDGWSTKWWLLSGNTPWYKNPLYYAGGVAGLLLFSAARKKRRRK